MSARPLPVSADTPTVIVASYRRSGTHLTIDSLINNGLGVHESYVNLDRLGSGHPHPLSATDFESELAKGGGKTVVLKTHTPHRSQIETVEEAALLDRLMADSRLIYVYRDPRDVMVSLWHFRLSFDPDYANQSSFSEHVERNIERWRKHVEYWLERGVPMVRFEDWADDYPRTLERTLLILGLERRPEVINVYDATDASREGRAGIKKIRDRLRSLAGRMPERPGGHASRRPKLTGIARRSGRIGDWRSMFDEKDLALVRDVLGDFLDRLGYQQA